MIWDDTEALNPDKDEPREVLSASLKRQEVAEADDALGKSSQLLY